MGFGRRTSTTDSSDRSGRRFSILDRFKQVAVEKIINEVFRLNELRRGITRRGSTSNTTGSDLEYDPAIRRKFSVQIDDDERSKRLHTSQAHLCFNQVDQNKPL